ncbi:MAG: hypothetical protein WC284_11055 [Candidimonas sp.]|jgi:hypothetical protein
MEFGIAISFIAKRVTRQFEQSLAKALAATLTSWLEPIVRM